MKFPSLKKDECCDVCGRCKFVCQSNAISFEIGDCGNYQPRVDEDQCRGCGVCVLACRSKTISGESFESSKHYIGCHIDKKVRDSSSSGGIFTALAERVLGDNGVVFGAAYDREGRTIRHISVDSKDKLSLLRKSKYVQSDWSDVYEQILFAIANKKMILFTGTPCQAYSINQFTKDYPYIYIVDLFCHGVAGARFFYDYLDLIEKMKQNKVSHIDFRHGSDRSNNFNISVVYDDKDNFEEEWSKNVFQSLYLGSATIKGSCFACEYHTSKHMSDITLGDFADRRYAAALGVSANHPSIISVNSDKGAKLLESVSKNLVLSELSDKEIIGRYYSVRLQGTGKWGYNPSVRDSFLKDYKSMGFVKAAFTAIYSDDSIYSREIANLKLIEAKNEMIFLYGCGEIGQRYASIIKHRFQHIKIKAYIVTSTESVPYSEIDGIPIISLAEMTASDREAPVLITVSPKYRDEIKSLLERANVKQIYDCSLN